MPSPFPGMDPHLEISGGWRDFHATFIATCRDAINDLLPDRYVARIDERFRVVEVPRDRGRTRYPDVAIVRTGTGAVYEAAVAGVAVLDLEPVMVRLTRTVQEEIRETRIEIRREPDWELVTSIELLSPANKEEPGFSAYLAKRADVIAQPVHLVELDLLIGGRRLPMDAPLPPGDYYALVSRAEQRPASDVFAWSVRRALPVIPIPLSRPDPDLLLNLAAIFATTFRRGRYERSINLRPAPEPAPRPGRPGLGGVAGPGGGVLRRGTAHGRRDPVKWA
ncbi:MAG: hypothetical protein JWN86_1853 [Planctomycetota bacterium]|nr:hypothetical protein [Planctomycetota bacterium]